MSEKRLEEIKDSIDFQKDLLGDDILINEKIELYNEVVRLRIEVSARETIALELQKTIDKAIEYIGKNTERAIVNGENQFLIDQEDIPNILNILKGVDKE